MIKKKNKGNIMDMSCFKHELSTNTHSHTHTNIHTQIHNTHTHKTYTNKVTQPEGCIHSDSMVL